MTFAPLLVPLAPLVEEAPVEVSAAPLPEPPTELPDATPDELAPEGEADPEPLVEPAGHPPSAIAAFQNGKTRFRPGISFG